jgi:hypothetical protein
VLLDARVLEMEGSDVATLGAIAVRDAESLAVAAGVVWLRRTRSSYVKQSVIGAPSTRRRGS